MLGRVMPTEGRSSRRWNTFGRPPVSWSEPRGLNAAIPDWLRSAQIVVWSSGVRRADPLYPGRGDFGRRATTEFPLRSGRLRGRPSLCAVAGSRLRADTRWTDQAPWRGTRLEAVGSERNAHSVKRECPSTTSRHVWFLSLQAKVSRKARLPPLGARARRSFAPDSANTSKRVTLQHGRMQRATITQI